MKDPYHTSDTEEAVLHRSEGCSVSTYVVRPEEWPLRPWQVVSLMNEARRAGYRQAQADIRNALGVRT